MEINKIIINVSTAEQCDHHRTACNSKIWKHCFLSQNKWLIIFPTKECHVLFKIMMENKLTDMDSYVTYSTLFTKQAPQSYFTNMSAYFSIHYSTSPLLLTTINLKIDIIEKV